MAVALGAFALSPTAAQAGVIITPVNVDLATVPFYFINVDGASQFGTSYTASTNTLKVQPSPGNLVASSITVPGTVIGPSTTFQSTAESFPPFPGTDTILGLDIVSGADNFYGFADFGGADGTVLKAYAFETSPNTPIDTPEPAPLTVLAIGAAAVLAIRRRSARQGA